MLLGGEGSLLVLMEMVVMMMVIKMVIKTLNSHFLCARHCCKWVTSVNLIFRLGL